jgi:hypothetical protein
MLSLKTSRQKGLKAWLKQYSTCLASVKYWVQTPVPPKKKKKVSATQIGRKYL